MGNRLPSDLQLHPNSLGPEAFLGGRDGFFRRSIVVPAWRLSLPETGFEMDLPERCFVNKCVGVGGCCSTLESLRITGYQVNGTSVWHLSLHLPTNSACRRIAEVFSWPLEGDKP